MVDFGLVMVVGAKQAGLSISETADLLQYPIKSAINHRFYRIEL